MGKYSANEIRNIVFVGPHGAGKTILIDAILHEAKAITRIGSVNDGTTVCDSDEEEKARKHSLTSAIAYAEYAGKLFNLVDTPGAGDFFGAAIAALPAADLLAVCIDVSVGVEMTARRAWTLAGELGLPRMVILTRMDGDKANFDDTLALIQDESQGGFGRSCKLLVQPNGEGTSFTGVSEIMSGDNENLKNDIIDTAVEALGDDDILMTFMDDPSAVTPEQIVAGMRQAVLTGKLAPVYCVAGEKGLGVKELLTGIADWGPDPLTVKRTLINDADEKVEWTPAADGGLAAQVFKVVSDPHVGKISFFRIYQGKLKAKDSPTISSIGKGERFNQIFRFQGDKRTEIEDAGAGEIVAVTKIDGLKNGDTIYTGNLGGTFVRPPLTEPMAGLAVSPKTRGDEQKMAQYMARMVEEDPMFRFIRDERTHEQVIRGAGRQHLDVMLSRLKNRYGLEVETRPPRIPYLETVTTVNEGSYRHRKQSGGAGQFAEVHIRIKPNERGKGFEFVNSIVGGVISGPFIPSVEKGVRAALLKGPVAGYPVVDVIVELFFGKEHPVDSKDIAFQIAGQNAFEEISRTCKPILLEPYVQMEISFPAEYMGTVQGDLSSRRGRPTGTEQVGNLAILKALVPLAEVQDYDSTLKGMTQATGFYTMSLSHYEPAPANVAQTVAAKAKADAER